VRLHLRTVTLSLIIIGLILTGWVDLNAQKADDNKANPGAKQLLSLFIGTLKVADLMLLNDGGAISGALMGEEFVVTLADSGETINYARSDVASISFGESTDSILLTQGDLILGTVEAESFSLMTRDGSEVIVAKNDLALTAFQFGAISKSTFSRIFDGLQAQNIYGLFAQTLITYDLVMYRDGRIWSGNLLNDAFTFHSKSFGTITLNDEDMSGIKLTTDPAIGQDYVTLKTGDVVDGRLDDASLPLFEPIALVDTVGQPLIQILQREDVVFVTYRQLASAFGGGGSSPGFGGGSGK
jgi:hypothetical protein